MRTNLKRCGTWLVTALCALWSVGCGVYTFSGSTLPQYLKSVDIPLFVNKSLQPDIAEQITEQVNAEVLESNLLRIVSEDGDATLQGAVLSYSNDPYTYESEDVRAVDVEEYVVNIRVQIEFIDNVKNEPLFEGIVEGEGVYDFENETEEIGRERAIDDIVEQVLNQSVQGW
ncbi:MAG: LPS assembly lipoprotein LptE [Chitinivibrionales bacterium]